MYNLVEEANLVGSMDEAAYLAYIAAGGASAEVDSSLAQTMAFTS